MLKGSSLESGYNRFLDHYLMPGLVSTGLKPDHLSVLGLLMSLVAGVGFAFYPLVGGLLTLLTGLLDTLDGSLARATGQSRKFGAFLDSVLDRYTELIIYIGVWFYFYRQGSTSPAFYLTFLLILFGSLMVSYTRARAEGLGERCMGGIFQRGERIILIGLAGILNPFVNGFIGSPPDHWIRDIVLIGVLIVLAVGTNLTAIWRFLTVLGKLKP
jgi:CDP-diacylglycerol---glycerol-3-phosphate 3-phosphatidyltransferase